MTFDFKKIRKEKTREIKILKGKRSLIAAIEKIRKKGENPIIAEIKRSSPIRGKLREIEVVKAAIEMEKGGACAVSVLTDKRFKGNIGDLPRVKEAVKIPVLRKDFIVDEFQIDQSYLVGADVVLLIVSLLRGKTKKFVEKIHQMGMEALVEIRSEKEIKFALDSGAKLIGINNRDLKTFKIDLATTEKLIPKIPKDKFLFRNFLHSEINNKTIVSESGINNKKDLARVMKAGAEAALIGTSIMLAENIKEKVEEFVKFKQNEPPR